MASTTAPKVPIYSGNDLKSTTDDALSPYLTTLPTPYRFTQDHTKSNVRFALGYSGVFIAGFTFYADRILGWEATTSAWVIAAVGAYFILNTLLTLWVWGVEAGEVFRGTRGSGESISISSSTKKYSPLYKLRVVYRSASNEIIQEKDLEAPFTTWFSADGIFHAEPFRRWLASNVDVLRQAAEVNKEEAGGASELVGQGQGLEGQDGKGAARRRGQ